VRHSCTKMVSGSRTPAKSSITRQTHNGSENLTEGPLLSRCRLWLVDQLAHGHGGWYGRSDRYWSHSLLVIEGVMLQIRATTLSTLVSHSRAVVSSLAVARVCPSGLKTTEETVPVWPIKVPSDVGWRGLLISHNRAVRSALAVARVRPSGPKATDRTGAVWPVSRVVPRLPTVLSRLLRACVVGTSR
jgi:hypothetical protein